MSAQFTSGLQLSGDFYRDLVRPLLEAEPHACALLGWGSDVLGYDTARSTDHGWGPRLQVFIDDAHRCEQLTAMLDARLPESYDGWPVRFGWDSDTPRLRVTVATLRDWMQAHLGVDATKGFSTLDWLVTPQQRLLEVVAGAVYADPRGDLEDVRTRLGWYPEEIWRWLLACQWHRLAQEEAFTARAVEVGDDLGSAVAAARQVRDVMRLALLLDRRYAPYQKWLGSAFAALPDIYPLAEHLEHVVGTADASSRAKALGAAYSMIAERHNGTGVTPQLPTTTGPYHSRPADVLMADRFADACLATVTDPQLLTLPLVGAVDQHTDNTDLFSDPRLFRKTAALYR